MNSDRRHELQQNDLAIYLNKVSNSIEPYSRGIAIGVGVLIVAAISWLLYSSQKTATRSDATLQLIQASATGMPEDLLSVSERYADTAAGAWARVYQANQYLAEGMDALYTDRASAEELLKDAESTFNRALENSKDRLLVSRAHYGIARAAEGIGDVDAAIAAYEQVIAVDESEAMVEFAQKRIDTLQSEEAKDFLAWFAEQDFTPAPANTPPSAFPELGDIQDGPDLKFDFGAGLDSRDLDGGIGLPADDAMDAEGDGDGEPSGDDLQLPEVTETGDEKASKPADTEADKDASEGETDTGNTESSENDVTETESNESESSTTETESTATETDENESTEAESESGGDPPAESEGSGSSESNDESRDPTPGE